MLRTRHLEKTKQDAVTKTGSFSGSVSLTESCRDELEWWRNAISTGKNYIRSDVFDFQYDSDSSLTGWGLSYQGTVTRGFSSKEERLLHINTLELKAVFNGLQVFFRDCRNCNILVRCDSTTAICYINKQGGCRSEINHSVAESIWKWCEERSIWIVASYINTKENVVADLASRCPLDENDYGLDNDSYAAICKVLGKPQIDLFATSKTRKCRRYISWYPDPEAETVDAFTVIWKDFFYAFPPFGLVGRALQKVVADKACGIMVVPLWRCQAWYPLFRKLVIGRTIILRKGTFSLFNPYRNERHQLTKDLSLMVAVVSSKR